MIIKFVDNFLYSNILVTCLLKLQHNNDSQVNINSLKFNTNKIFKIR